MMFKRTSGRRGFVLITILMILIGISVLAFTASYASRTAAGSATNRTALASAHWKAYGCIERVRATAHAAMTSVSPDLVIAVWDSLDRVVRHSPLLVGTSCTVSLRAVGAGLNINDAPPERLSRFFAALNIPPSRADSLVDALLDWRDPDLFPRPLGAERAWYQAAHRLVPRDGAFADPKELLQVRGFEQFGDTLSLIQTESARMPLGHTPLPILAALPGMSPEAVARAADLRLRNERIVELLVLGATLPTSARDTLMAHYAELARMTTTEPEGWIVVATGLAGSPGVEVAMEVRLARGGTRVATMRRR